MSTIAIIAGTAAIAAPVGFLVCAVMTQAAIADSSAEVEDWQSWLGLAVESEREHRDAHTRCADALSTCQRKLSAIRDLLDTPRTIRKGELAMILDGEVA